MSAAHLAMAFAGFEAELALRAQRAGRLDGRRRHGGWAIILAVIASALFVLNGLTS